MLSGTNMAGRGLRDSLRFLVKPEARSSVTLRTVVVEVLMDVFDIKVKDVVCLQDFPQQGTYDITFGSSEVCWKIFEEAKKRKDDILELFEILPLFLQEEKMITVHLYNPFADPALVWAFLETYCEKLRGGDKVMNKFGIWTGKYRFFGNFRKDEECIGGVKRPPAVFTIGGERGFLFYPGQPKYCRKCFKYGHLSADCDEGLVCRFCNQSDHTARDCTKSKVCDICKREGHVARQCDKYQDAKRTFADIVARENFQRRMDAREKQRLRRSYDVGGGVRGGPAEVNNDAAPSGVLWPVIAKDAVPRNRGVSADGAGNASASTGRVEAGVAGSGAGDPSLGEEDVASREPEGHGEEVMQQDDEAEESEEESGTEISVAGSGRSMSRLIGDLSESGEEMDDADEEEEDLECGQRFVPSAMEGGDASVKRARVEGEDSGSGEGSLCIALSGDSELESASSPGPKKWQRRSKKDKEGREEENMEEFP